MKKYLVILIAALLVLTGCGKKEEKVNGKKIGNTDGLVLKYESIAGSVVGSPTDRILIYKDKKMILEHTNDAYAEENSSLTIDLTEQQYQDVIEIAFSEKFLGLAKDLTSMETAGGLVNYITVYYDDTSFTTGGQHITNTTFNSLEELLLSYSGQ